MQAYISIIVAAISALTILIGYGLQKHKEREFEFNKIRQDLYMRFVRNLSEKLMLFDDFRKDDDVPERVTHEDIGTLMSLIADKYPELHRNIKESAELGALMALYASDDAITACATFFRASWESMQPNSNVRPDKDHLLYQLRKSLFRRTKVSVDDIKFISTK